MGGVVLAGLIEGFHEAGDLVIANLPLGGHDLTGTGGDEAASQAGPVSADFALANAAPAGGKYDEIRTRKIEGGDIAGEEDVFGSATMEDEPGPESASFFAFNDEAMSGKVEGSGRLVHEVQELSAREVFVDWGVKDGEFGFYARKGG